jgi:hypothetical protein
MAQAGYSGTPLVRKLGIKEGFRIYLLNPPDGYSEWIDPVPEEVKFVRSSGKGLDLAHIFVSERKVLKAELERLIEAVEPDGMIWVSWHKKASKIPTEITEDVVREIALPMGLVDVKVCAVSDIWSGLKLVIRKELRQRIVNRES